MKTIGICCGLMLLLCLASNSSIAQQAKIKGSLFEGVFVAGYADCGAYINCTGPAVKYSRSKLSVLAGLLPSLRIKEDKMEEGRPKNSLITPTLGFGLTAFVGHFALQLPAFYNAKTATSNGNWKIGIGLGYKF